MNKSEKALSYIASVFLNGWISQLLWNAVLVKLFPVIPEIGYWQMMGLMIMLNSLFNYKYYSKED
jgi:hypothetical protein